MVETEQPIFESTRASAGYRASVIAPVGSQNALQSMMSRTSVTSLAADESTLLLRFLEAGLATIAHKKANPGFVVPPHACLTHGMCFHPADKCNSNTPNK